MTAGYHKLLTEQIQAAMGEGAPIPAAMKPLLKQVSATYTDFDKAREAADSTIKLRTEQLMASTSRAYSFFDSLRRGFIMCDINPEVVLTNESVRQMLAPSDWKLGAIDQLLEPQVHLRESVRQSLATNRPIEFKEVNVGKAVLRFFIAPMVNEVKGDKQQIGAVILVEDITEEKVLERSKDEFFFIASHELRTPLTAIRGSASVIKKYYAKNLTDPDMAEMVDDIHESAVRLIEIVNDFLDVSALEQGKIEMHPEVCKLPDIVSDVARQLQSLCDAKGIKLVVEPGVAATPAVFADKQRIEQVIYNLVGNAIKFTDVGSITIAATADDKLAHCTVTDTGRGMSAESHALLFRKFQQAGNSLLSRDSTKGTGLGLYISKLIVELSGGKIGLERSEPGQGSTFAFSLPLAKK